VISFRKIFSRKGPVDPAPAPSPLRVEELRSLEEFRAFLARGEGLGPGKWEMPATDAAQFEVSGYCYVDRRWVAFKMDDLYATRTGTSVHYNWRERMVCPLCGLNNRLRASVHLFETVLHPALTSRIWLTERLSPLYDALHPRFPSLVGSEFFGDGKVSGWTSLMGVRHEDITASSFGDGSLDGVLSFDVLEHVPDPQRAFREVFRILAPGGTLLFSAPFIFGEHPSRTRARRLPDGTVEHLMPPQYHSDPVNSSQGILCYTEFGWDTLDQLKAAGFDDAYCGMYDSSEYGYVGGLQVVFVARKPG